MTLIIGGTRSGKTAAAEKLCKTYGQRVLYLAITIPSDPDTKEKIKRSRGHRPYYWDTYETSSNITELISEKGNDYDVILIDSINNLVFNLITSYYSGNPSPTYVDCRNLEIKILANIRTMLEACQKQSSDLVFVSTEMGMGMPVTSIQRSYCEISGRANQLLAEVCASVYMTVCGIEMKIK